MSNLIATKRSDLLDHYLKLDQGGAIQAECEWILLLSLSRAGQCVMGVICGENRPEGERRLGRVIATSHVLRFALLSPAISHLSTTFHRYRARRSAFYLLLAFASFMSQCG